MASGGGLRRRIHAQEALSSLGETSGPGPGGGGLSDRLVLMDTPDPGVTASGGAGDCHSEKAPLLSGPQCSWSWGDGGGRALGSAGGVGGRGRGAAPGAEPQRAPGQAGPAHHSPPTATESPDPERTPAASSGRGAPAAERSPALRCCPSRHLAPPRGVGEQEEKTGRGWEGGPQTGVWLSWQLLQGRCLKIQDKHRGAWRLCRLTGLGRPADPGFGRSPCCLPASPITPQNCPCTPTPPCLVLSLHTLVTPKAVA